MLEYINRDVLIIFPKQPLIDWASTIFPNDEVKCPALMANDKGNVYLIAEAYNSESALEEVRANFEVFFHEELGNWTYDESLWPKKITWKMFNEWFNYSVQSMVLDVLDEPIEKKL